MSTTSADSTLTFRVAYDEALPDILALPAQGLLQVTADIPSVGVRALGSMPQIRALRDQVAQLPFFDLAAFDKLETYARALGRAQVLLSTASQPRAPLPDLTERATKIRETLLSDAQ